ncbi:MAG TPA: ABC transporter ATP-binding protein [Anaerolineaceae bacterium]|nr:ABC transporter ATP-binding protein [Anaerolineaceae bacterium]
MVKLEGIRKTFGKVRAVDGVDLQVKKGEMLCLLGPSGCGKTTLLRILSGFEQPEEGKIIMNGQDVTKLSPDKRPTSLVFQSYALFPHMTVYENIAYGLRVKKIPSKEIRQLVAGALEMVGLSGLEERSIRQLSGGQQQRVALARGLVMKPAVLLLDEPLSNLDAKLRVETRIQIRELQRNLGITSIFVTHDQEEALTISDRIAVMNKGKIIQIGSPEEIYNHPNSEFVADFIGKSNILTGEYKKVSDEEAQFILSNSSASIRIRPVDNVGEKPKLILRPEQILLTKEKNPDPKVNCLPARIEHITFLGEMIYYHVGLENEAVLLVPVYHASSRYDENDQVFISWDVDAGKILLK